MCGVLREQTPLEEGEIPWVMYNEDSGSSSDEDPDGVSQFVHPGLFILDGNNNLEDDSSMSEDLDTEWRSINLIDKKQNNHEHDVPIKLKLLYSAY